MSKHVYRVEVNGVYHAYVKANTAQEAKRAALAHVTVERLDAGDIIDLVERGIAITDAATVGAQEPSDSEDQAVGSDGADVQA